MLDGKMTVSLIERNAEPANWLSINSEGYFFALQQAAWRPAVQIHYSGFLIKYCVTNTHRNSNASFVSHNCSLILCFMQIKEPFEKLTLGSVSFINDISVKESC